MTKHSRRPTAFAVDDPHVIVAEAEPNEDFGTIQLASEDGRKLPALAALTPKRRFRWGTVLWSALGGLFTLALGLAISQLIEELYVRSIALGWVGVALAAAAALALIVIVAREVRGLLKLSAMEHVRNKALAAIASDKRTDGVAVAHELLSLTRNAPTLAHARKIVTSHLDDIIDGADMVRLVERNLLSPLDQEAKRLVSSAATRVSIVTAISPRALVDMLFVFGTAIALIRRLAYLYGARPGTLGLVRLVRLCIAHLTVTGGMALGDSLVQQVLGHGIAAKLSARLGEGVLNGLLTARLGLAAIEVVRPLPFNALPQPALSDVAAQLLRQRDPAASS
jgi:putative membrane protein